MKNKISQNQKFTPENKTLQRNKRNGTKKMIIKRQNFAPKLTLAGASKLHAHSCTSFSGAATPKQSVTTSREYWA
jgi:hypothetical protein